MGIGMDKSEIVRSKAAGKSTLVLLCPCPLNFTPSSSLLSYPFRLQMPYYVLPGSGGGGCGGPG